MADHASTSGCGGYPLPSSTLEVATGEHISECGTSFSFNSNQDVSSKSIDQDARVFEAGRPVKVNSKRTNNDWVHWTKEECILSWSLSTQTQATIEAQQLRSIHSEILALMQLVGAEYLMTSTMRGLIRKRDSGDELATQLSREDTIIRLGQLLCRWASEQSPPVGLRIGVDTGELKAVSLPGQDKLSYYGPACQRADMLAESAPKDLCVHLFPETRAKLRVFERMRFTFWTNPMANNECCYLDPWEEATEQESQEHGVDDEGASRGRTKAVGCSSLSHHIANSRKDSRSRLSQAIEKMDVAEFGEWLEEHGVDTSKFGKGQAKTVSEFHKEIVEDRKSYLVLKRDQLSRILEVARINFIAKDDSGTDCVLHLGNQVLPDGRTVASHQKLDCRIPDGVDWHDAFRIGLQYEFDLDPDVIDKVFMEEGYWYKEHTGPGPNGSSYSVPGIPSIYLTHEIRLRITDKDHEELHKIGLPSMSDFITAESSETGDACKSWQWLPSGTEPSPTDGLTDLLEQHDVKVHEFSNNVFEELLEEVSSKDSHLLVRNGELLRSLQIVKVWLLTDLVGVPHILVSTRKVKQGKVTFEKSNKAVVGKMKAGQGWEEGVSLALSSRLGLDELLQKRLIHVHSESYKFSEEIEYSRTYPGLKTVYGIHEVTCTVLEPHKLLGLPDGNDVCFTRTCFDKTGSVNDVQVFFYSWKPQEEVRSKYKKGLLGSWKATQYKKDMKDILNESLSTKEKAAEVDPKRRLPPPAPLLPPAIEDRTSECVIEDIMKNSRGTNWDLARRAARRIRDEDYSCGNFCDDCLGAFPELALYVAGGNTSSGRAADDEFQRTMGALFAVYWLMRLFSDGPRSFAFGVGDDWKPLSYESASPCRVEEERKKRKDFLDEVNWDFFKETLIAAGLLLEDGGHDEERTLAMLALTAIHDIMKIQEWLPVVSEEHSGSSCCGDYKAGETISDHDVALGYVLECFPNALPSFAGLPEEQKRSVKFTQCNMAYNMGWLVQAEAPPGALFGKFKSVIENGEARPEDIAFYFTHWLTDLAGAEPYPQEGCEKFVLKFPQKVLLSFVKSFPVVKQLSTKSETSVLDDYLVWRWQEHSPSLGVVPQGSGSVAQMRLNVMAQSNGQAVLSAYRALQDHDRRVLDEELARTGCKGQRYSRDPLASSAGPALLVYYAPALMQTNCKSNEQTAMVMAMQVLAEVLRQGRNLWPLDESSAGETITLQIHALKDLEVQAIKSLPAGEVWALTRNSSVNALVQRTQLITDAGDHQELDESTRVLRFFQSRPRRNAYDDRRHSSIKFVDASSKKTASFSRTVSRQDPDSSSISGRLRRNTDGC